MMSKPGRDSWSFHKPKPLVSMLIIESLEERVGLYIHELILSLEVLHIFFFNEKRECISS